MMNTLIDCLPSRMCSSSCWQLLGPIASLWSLRCSSRSHQDIIRVLLACYVVRVSRLYDVSLLRHPRKRVAVLVSDRPAITQLHGNALDFQFRVAVVPAVYGRWLESTHVMGLVSCPGTALSAMGSPFAARVVCYVMARVV